YAKPGRNPRTESGDNSERCAGMIPQAPCTMNCSRNAPSTNNANDGANAHKGTTAIAHSNATIMERLRPQRSEMNPNTTPPMIAPTIESAVIRTLSRGPNPQWRSRKVGYMSCFQCEAMLRPSWPQLSCLVFFQTSDSFTLKRTNKASSAGNPPMKNSGRHPQRGNTKK